MTLTDRKDRAAEEGEDLRLNSKGVYFNMEQKNEHSCQKRGNKGNKLIMFGVRVVDIRT